ncbi:hypothetical protein B0T39_09155 [Chromobacterium haemolyticum]|nr:hypothetical protein B0T39_09155 [Chromobacterium haemolyticum]
MAGTELPDCVVSFGSESESIVSMRCKKVGWRGRITSAGAGGSVGQIAAGGALVAQPELSAQTSNSPLKFHFPIFQSLLIGRCG